MKKKPLRLTNIAKAEGRIAAILGFGEILTLSDAHGVTFTVGPWTPAVGPRDRKQWLTAKVVYEASA